MNCFKRIFALATAFVMVLSLASCTITLNNPNFNKETYETEEKEMQTVTLEGLKLRVPAEMKYDNSLDDAEGNPMDAYACDDYRVAVRAYSAAALKFKGYKTTDDIIALMMEDSEYIEMGVMPYSGTKYITYTEKIGDDIYNTVAFVLEAGYNFFIVEFVNTTETEDQYMDEYEKIFESAELAEEPEKTKEVSCGKVILTLGGEASPSDDGEVYICDKYLVSAATYYSELTAEDYAKSVLDQYEVKDENDNDVTKVITDGDIAYYAYYNKNNYYYDYYMKKDDQIVCLVFVAYDKADDELFEEFKNIILNARLEAEE